MKLLRIILLFFISLFIGNQVAYAKTELVLSQTQLSFSIEQTQSFKNLEKQVQPNIGFLKEKCRFVVHKGISARNQYIFSEYFVRSLAKGGSGVLGTIVKTGNKIDYTNPAGRLLKWTEQSVGDIDNAILSAKNLDAAIPGNPGKIIEAKVGEFVKQQKQLDGYAFKIKRVNNSIAGDIDVSTLDELIEVKKSFSAWSGKKNQVNKFVNSSMDDFLNPYNKKVILYIDEPLTVAQKISITNYIPSNVTLVNSLTELQLILK